MASIIWFNSKTPGYVYLSNFYCSPFFAGGWDGEIEEYKTVEHFYQSGKATNRTDFYRILNAKNAYEAKSIARTMDIFEDWESTKLDVMRKGLFYKFTASGNSEIRSMLVDTGSQYLMHQSPWDTYWGAFTRSDGSVEGRNILGRLLMGLRHFLRDF